MSSLNFPLLYLALSLAVGHRRCIFQSELIHKAWFWIPSDLVFDNSHCVIVTRVNQHRFASDFGHLSAIYQNDLAKIVQCELGFRAKIRILNIAFSNEKVISFESGEKYEQIKHHLQEKTNTWVDFDVTGRQGMDFFTGGSVMDYVFRLEAMV